MKQPATLIIALFILINISCNREESETPFAIEGITTGNFPRIDGSTSTGPLQIMITCKLLGGRYHWRQMLESNGTWTIAPDYDDIPHSFFSERVKISQTHQSFVNLIDNNTDIIFTARLMSEDEKAYADNAGVTLVATPIALDAFIFIANPANPVQSLTQQEIRNIYMGLLTNWRDVGGNNATIVPFVRNANSGSQELMETLVMKDLVMPQWPVEMLSSMMLAFTAIRSEVNGLCYTVYYYKEQIVRDNNLVKTLAVDGVSPNRATIRERKYPYTTEVYAVIRSDLDQSSMAYKLYELLKSPAARAVIEESGYVSID